MKKIMIKSPVGYVKHKSTPSQPKAMVLEAFPNTSHGFIDTDKADRFYSTGKLFRIAISVKTDATIKAGVVLAVRADTGKSKLSDWEENSITIPLMDVEKLIQGLQN